MLWWKYDKIYYIIKSLQENSLDYYLNWLFSFFSFFFSAGDKSLTTGCNFKYLKRLIYQLSLVFLMEDFFFIDEMYTTDGVFCIGFCSMWGHLVFSTCRNCIIETQNCSYGTSWYCKSCCFALFRSVIVISI